MLFYLPNPSQSSIHFERIIDTATGIIYDFCPNPAGVAYLLLSSINAHADNFSKIDGTSALPFWQALLARATPVTHPGETAAQ